MHKVINSGFSRVSSTRISTSFLYSVHLNIEFILIMYPFMAIIGKGKAAVALALKIITIVRHLIVNNEVYEDMYARHKYHLK